ncbi:MAG: c-type cytochrome [Pseudomonadota bacterium]
MAFAVAGSVILWASNGPFESIIPYQNAKMVARGEALYSDYCASCHGANLEGQVANWQERDADGYLPAPPHDETGHTWHHPDAQLFLITKHGTEAMIGGTYRSNMQGFGDVLADDDLRAVLAYIKSTWPRRVIERHNQINQMAGD